MNNSKLTNNKIVKLIKIIISKVKVIVFLIITISILIYSYNSFNQKRYNVSKEVIFQVSDNNEEDEENYLKTGKDYNIQVSKNNLDDNEISDANKDSESEDLQDNSIDETAHQEGVLDESKYSDDLQDEEETSNEENQTTSPDDSQPITEPITEPIQDPISVPVINSTNVVEGQNPTEASALMTYVNQYRAEAGISPLTWNANLEQDAQMFARHFATGEGDIPIALYCVIGRQCNGAKNAQRAVSDWITGNDYVSSEADCILSEEHTRIGGALYYLPNGNEDGYHYFWVLCLM